MVSTRAFSEVLEFNDLLPALREAQRRGYLFINGLPADEKSLDQLASHPMKHDEALNLAENGYSRYLFTVSDTQETVEVRKLGDFFWIMHS